MTERRYQKWSTFNAEESGQDTIEHALLFAVIALVAIISLKSLAISIGNFWMHFIARAAAVWV